RLHFGQRFITHGLLNHEFFSPRGIFDRPSDEPRPETREASATQRLCTRPLPTVSSALHAAADRRLQNGELPEATPARSRHRHPQRRGLMPPFGSPPALRAG